MRELRSSDQNARQEKRPPVSTDRQDERCHDSSAIASHPLLSCFEGRIRRRHFTEVGKPYLKEHEEKDSVGS
jgi:hypothetical protein